MNTKEEGPKKKRRQLGVQQEPMSHVVAGKREQGEDGDTHPVYEARRALTCVQCRRAIAKGEYFTKQRHPSLQSGNRKIYPCCVNCYPFVEIIDVRPRATQQRESH